MQLSMWTYPWDIADIGLDAVSDELRHRAGMNTVSIVASYHAGKFLQPRSPVRKSYFPQDGTVYFRPTEARWAGKTIRPLVADQVEEQGDMLRRLCDRREEGGLAVSCWTVCLHNTRLGLLHPGHVTRTAFGDANIFSLCPSSPAVQDYAVTLVADMTHAYRPDRVELETPGFMGFSHGYHHEKDGLGLTGSDEFLLSLCFCDHCLAAAAADGVDALAARETVRRLVCASCERAVPVETFADFPARGPAAFAAHPEIVAHCAWRETPVTALLRRIRDAAHPQTRVIAITAPEAWREGIDVSAAAEATDGILLCVYDEGEEDVARHVADVRRRIGGGKDLVAGFRLFHTEAVSAEHLERLLRAARQAGADGFNFYNYGLVPAARLDWAGRALRALQLA
ncbi:hypothetical protein [Shinella pollutisoli]|uniref:Uncharacterized protein n=1 Tax=Shinella pollutisoli TaxID=2250594 RepID=A0ABV7DMN0_9HYPH|nr:hypothetical protein [Shinella pollutisoli]